MTEKTIIWAITILVVAAIFVPYYLKFLKSQKATGERRKEAHELGINRPKGQFPMINRSLCIGCGACARVCPEGDVLGIVWGTAEVINGQRCIGHSLCEVVCPVSALVVGLGDIRTRPDIPVLTDCNETTVPGIFIAGELGGLALIRHAIAQGTIVGMEIVKRLKSGQRQDGISDLIIIGAGPSGMSCALAAKQHGYNAIILDQYDLGGTIRHYPRKKIVMVQSVEIPMHGLLPAGEHSKEDLLELWEGLSKKFQLDIRTNQIVKKIKKTEEIIEVVTSDGTRYNAMNVVMALGRRGTPRKLGVPGEELTKVLYNLTDAQSYKNEHVLVVGGGDSAIEAAVGLAGQPGNTVSISYRKVKFFRVKKKNEHRIEEQINLKKVIPYFDSEIKEVRPKSVVILQKDKEIEIPNDWIIVQAGGTPPFEMVREAGVAFGGDQISMAEADKKLKPAPA